MSLSGLSTNIAQGIDNIPIKKLLMIIDMARMRNAKPSLSDISECYEALKANEYDLEYYW